MMPNLSTQLPPVKAPTVPKPSTQIPPVQTTAPPMTASPIVGQNYVAGATGGTDFINYNSPTATAGMGTLGPAGPTAGLGDYVNRGQYGTVRDPAAAGALVQGNLDSLLSTDNQYIQNARLRGLEGAAVSGLRNSSIAQGASQRAAIEASMPILDQIQNLNNQRENMQFTGQENALNRGLTWDQQQNQIALQGQQNELDRQAANLAQRNQYGFQGQQNQFDRSFQNNQMQNQLRFTAGQAALDRTQGVNNQILAGEIAQNKALNDYKFQSYLQGDQAKINDWLSNQNYTREINAKIAQTQINTVADLANMINQYAVDNPEVYTPAVVQGLQNFLSGSFLSTMQQYFPNSVGGGS